MSHLKCFSSIACENIFSLISNFRILFVRTVGIYIHTYIIYRILNITFMAAPTGRPLALLLTVQRTKLETVELNCQIRTVKLAANEMPLTAKTASTYYNYNWYVCVCVCVCEKYWEESKYCCAKFIKKNFPNKFFVVVGIALLTQFTVAYLSIDGNI